MLLPDHSTTFYRLPRALACFCLGAAALLLTVQPARAQGTGFSLLTSFGGGQGSAKVPYAPLIQGTDGNFYCTTTQGGGFQSGAAFVLSPGGSPALLTRFGGNYGISPATALVQGTNGNFYGNTEAGGYYNGGVIFQIAPNGTETVLYDLGSSNDPATPEGALIQATDDFFYGTSSAGGYYNQGTVFRISAAGQLTVLYDFGLKNDPAVPNAALVQGTDGNFYGTTTYGGYYDQGTVFQITPAGSLTVLHDFTGRDGANPDTALIQGRDGNFYGTTANGGPAGAGTVFQITPGAALTTLYTFPNQLDGQTPEGALIEATDGFLYGTTEYGGAAGGGAVYRIAEDGTGYANFHDFAGGDGDGANPLAGLLQTADGVLYGTTAYGGTARLGTAFRLNLGLPARGSLPVQAGTASVSAAVKGRGVATLGVRNARFFVSRAGGDFTQPLTVSYQLGGTATNGIDYRLLTGAVTIPAGQTAAKVVVVPLVSEMAARTVALTLFAPTGAGYTVAGATGGTVTITP